MIQTWYDQVAQTFGSYDEAISGFENSVAMMKESLMATLNRKLSQGFRLVGTPVVEYVRVVNVAECESALSSGSAYIEIRIRSEISQIEKVVA